MTAPAIGQTSTTKVVPYISPGMFMQARRGVDVTGLAPKGTAEDQTAALADYIRRATAMMDSFMLGTLASTFDTEVGEVTVRPDGLAVIRPRFRPVIALTAFAAGPGLNRLAAYSDLSAANVGPSRITLPVGPFGTWNTSAGPLQFGTPAPVPGSMWARWTTCNGYPVTWLTAAAAKDAVQISVADGSGIVAGRTQLILYADGYRFPFVPSAVSNAVAGLGQPGPAVLTLPPLPVDVANDPLYPTYVSALPSDVVEAAELMTRGLIRKTGGGNVMASTQQQAKADPYGSGDDIAAAYEMINAYQMVQQ